MGGILMAAVWFCGCEPVPITPRAEEARAQELAELKRENRKLSRRLEDTEKQKDILEKEKKSLQTRSAALSDRLLKLQRNYEKQTELLDLLRTLPKERDQHRAEAEKYKQIILKMRLFITKKIY